MKEDKRPIDRQRIAAFALPVLYAAYPVLALMAHNIEEVSLDRARPALAYAITISVILLVVLRLALRDWGKASLICTAALLVFFSYGHVYAIAKTWSLGGFVIGRHRYLLPLSFALMGVWTWYVLRRLRKTDTVLGFFVLVGLASLSLPVATIVAHGPGVPSPAPTTPAGEPIAQQAARGDLPDIYYIILDGYAREDVLRDLYGFDNSEFLSYLEEQGFYVASDARSNYMQTMLSFASSLNMRYLDDIAASMGHSSDDRSPLRNLISQSAVRETLSAKGYRMVAFYSGYGAATIFGADVYLAPEEAEKPKLLYWSFNEFEGLLLESTMARALIDARSLTDPSCAESPIEAPYLRQRDRVLYTLNKLEEVSKWEGNYFVVAHIISPHPPYVFGPNGETLCHAQAYSLLDASGFSGSTEDYIKGYRDQLTYLNKLLPRTIARILAQSDPPPIVILQADHGPGAYTDSDSAERSNIRERLGILNAYYLPGEKSGLLYESISPVNSFRVVLNAYFEGRYELLPDESYFSTWGRPYDFVNVTERVDTD